MIDSVFSSLSEELSEYLQNKLSSDQDVYLATSPSDAEDMGVEKDSVFLSLVNIEQERLSNTSITKNPDRGVSIYLYILVSAGIADNNYESALSKLSMALSFFQEKSVWTHENSPGLHADIDKLTFEMINYDMRELSQLWSMRGGVYYPSAVYKARIVNIKDGNQSLSKARFTSLKTNLQR